MLMLRLPVLFCSSVIVFVPPSDFASFSLIFSLLRIIVRPLVARFGNRNELDLGHKSVVGDGRNDFARPAKK